MMTIARSGPRPQFMPTTSAPAARRFFAPSAGLSPHIVRSRSWISSYWKNMVAITGRSATALHARIAAVPSCGKLMVSTREKIAPALARRGPLLLERLEVLLVGDAIVEGVVEGQTAGRPDRARHEPRRRRRRPRPAGALLVSR